MRPRPSSALLAPLGTSLNLMHYLVQLHHQERTVARKILSTLENFKSWTERYLIQFQKHVISLKAPQFSDAGSNAKFYDIPQSSFEFIMPASLGVPGSNCDYFSVFKLNEQLLGSFLSRSKLVLGMGLGNACHRGQGLQLGNIRNSVCHYTSATAFSELLKYRLYLVVA